MSLDKRDISTIRGAIREEVAILQVPIHDKLDGLAKGLADVRGEQFAHQATHDRHERWINKLANKIGIKLEV